MIILREHKFYIELQMVGVVHSSDYRLLLPTLEHIIHTRKTIKILIDITNLVGYTWSALWSDFRFGIKYFNLFKKIAVLGEFKWDKLVDISRMFFAGKLLFFYKSKEDLAIRWLRY